MPGRGGNKQEQGQEQKKQEKKKEDGKKKGRERGKEVKIVLFCPGSGSPQPQCPSSSTPWLKSPTTTRTFLTPSPFTLLLGTHHALGHDPEPDPINVMILNTAPNSDTSSPAPAS